MDDLLLLAWTLIKILLIAVPLIVAVAFQQFYLLDLKRQWWRLLLAVLLFAGIKWLLLAGFAWLLVRLVMAQLA